MAAKFSSTTETRQISPTGALFMLSLCGGWLLAGCTALPPQQVVVANGGALPFAQSSLTVDAEKPSNPAFEVIHDVADARVESLQSIGVPSEVRGQAEVETPASLLAAKQDAELPHQNSTMATEPNEQDWFVFRGELLSLALKPKPVDLQFGKFTIGGSLAEAFSSRNPLNALNPFVPRNYGAVERNLARDLTTGRISGLKLFSVEF
jgi:hypothetical protein